VILHDGARIAIIGGGPAGSFFSIFASKLARDMGKALDFTIYERKSFVSHGASGCNMCAGVVSESLVQNLALEGINLPATVVRWGIESYFFHIEGGSVEIKSSRLRQRGIATVFRGGGPAGSLAKGIQSFDDFLLQKAVEHGAHVKRSLIDGICMEGEKPRLYSGKNMLQECDLLVGAFGIKASTGKMYEDLGSGYKVPPTIKTAQSEIELGSDWVVHRFGHAIHIFLLRIPGIKFVSVIPKGDYITVSVLGKDPKLDHIKAFLGHHSMKKFLPSGFQVPEKFCHCFPKISVGAARKPFANRTVFVGDASSSRLYKDGIGSAYITAKAAAHTALLEGIGEKDFQEHYLPTCKSLNRDNLFGQFLFAANHLMSIVSPISRSYFNIVQREQKNLQKNTPYSDILWDMFTGSRFYKDIFLRALHPSFVVYLFSAMVIYPVKKVFFSFKNR
jgi:flavin-dependent dehydrogenase